MYQRSLANLWHIPIVAVDARSSMLAAGRRDTASPEHPFLLTENRATLARVGINTLNLAHSVVAFMDHHNLTTLTIVSAEYTDALHRILRFKQSF